MKRNENIQSHIFEQTFVTRKSSIERYIRFNGSTEKSTKGQLIRFFQIRVSCLLCFVRSTDSNFFFSGFLCWIYWTEFCFGCIWFDLIRVNKHENSHSLGIFFSLNMFGGLFEWIIMRNIQSNGNDSDSNNEWIILRERKKALLATLTVHTCKQNKPNTCMKMTSTRNEAKNSIGRHNITRKRICSFFFSFFFLCCISVRFDVVHVRVCSTISQPSINHRELIIIKGKIAHT